MKRNSTLKLLGYVLLVATACRFSACSTPMDSKYVGTYFLANGSAKLMIVNRRGSLPFDQGTCLIQPNDTAFMMGGPCEYSQGYININMTYVDEDSPLEYFRKIKRDMRLGVLIEGDTLVFADKSRWTREGRVDNGKSSSPQTSDPSSSPSTPSSSSSAESMSEAEVRNLVNRIGCRDDSGVLSQSQKMDIQRVGPYNTDRKYYPVLINFTLNDGGNLHATRTARLFKDDFGDWVCRWVY